jgi:hypothetical protein
MQGIQYIIDDQGEKTAVVINLEQWGDRMGRVLSSPPTPFPLKKYTFRLRQKCVLKF